MTDIETFSERLAVCSWSLEPSDPGDLVEKLKSIGISRIQLALGPLAYEKVWKNTGTVLAQAGITVVSAMFGTMGEDYTSPATIRETGGIVPDATWNDNWKHIKTIIPIAAEIGCGLVSFHAGFLPESRTDPNWKQLHSRLVQIAEAFAAAGLNLALGSRQAAVLQAFLQELKQPHVGVNFDPANMILYGKGDPVDGIKTLLPHVMQVHVKDALPADRPGIWGEEVVVGTGAVHWPAFLQVLQDGNFTGNFCIEREAGQQRVQDIIAAKRFLQS